MRTFLRALLIINTVALLFVVMKTCGVGKDVESFEHYSSGGRIK